MSPTLRKHNSTLHGDDVFSGGRTQIVDVRVHDQRTADDRMLAVQLNLTVGERELGDAELIRQHVAQIAHVAHRILNHNTFAV